VNDFLHERALFVARKTEERASEVHGIRPISMKMDLDEIVPAVAAVTR
jgi:hypothetical protein